jgi:hypothetical protein
MLMTSESPEAMDVRKARRVRALERSSAVEVLNGEKRIFDAIRQAYHSWPRNAAFGINTELKRIALRDIVMLT